MVITYHFFLKNRKNQNGEQPIYLRVTQNRKHKYLSTGISIAERYWNSKAEEVRKSYPQYKSYNQQLSKFKEKLFSIESETPGAKIKAYRNKHKADVFKLGQQLSYELKADGNLHQLKKLQVVLRKLEAYTGKDSLPIAEITPDFLEDFEKHLRRNYGNSGATINKNFALLKKIVAQAVNDKLLKANPFLSYKLPKRDKKRTKVKLTIKQIQAIEALELEQGSFEWHTRNAFLFSFYSAGIRFGDICCLTWNDVKGGQLRYRMNKNEKDFKVHLNEHQKEILTRYTGAGTEYIFPFLNDLKHYTPLELRKAISVANARVNGKKQAGHETGLKLIAKLAGIDANVTFHVSRHSFAQYAVEQKGLTVYEAMHALRHSSISITAAYLKDLNAESTDNVLSKVF